MSVTQLTRKDLGSLLTEADLRAYDAGTPEEQAYLMAKAIDHDEDWRLRDWYDRRDEMERVR